MLIAQETLASRVRARMDAARVALLSAPKPKKARTEVDHDKLDAEMMRAEMVLVDKAAAQLRRKLDSQARTSPSYEHQEAAAELHALRRLRRELERDAAFPITHDRYGNPLTDRLKHYRRARATELREQLTAEAERAESVGDLRRARGLRHDALRARHIAEHEMHLRPSLRGYTHA
jgi:hypothetical protein